MLTDDEVLSTLWPEMVQLIDYQGEQLQSPGVPDTHPGSALQADDEATAPWQTSHAYSVLLLAGIDNLSAIRHLVFGRPDDDPIKPVFHPAAPFVLARAAIENLAAALWILGPEDRTERTIRTLRWYMQDAKDHGMVRNSVPQFAQIARSRETRLTELIERAKGVLGAPLPREKIGFKTTAAVKFASEYADAEPDHINTLFGWQLCSGLSHARPWARQSFLRRMETGVDDRGVAQIRLESTPSRVYSVTDNAMRLCGCLMQRHVVLNTPVPMH